MRYRLQRHDGTDCSATMVPITVLRMVPIQRYRQSGVVRKNQASNTSITASTTAIYALWNKKRNESENLSIAPALNSSFS